MMKDALRICGVLCLLGSCVNAAGKGNYSVQLMKGLAPAGWTPKQWAAAADAMIGKTQAHILTDLVEDLAIALKIPDQKLRNEIDFERTSIGLPPLQPAAQKTLLDASIQNRHRPIEDPDDILIYLPPGWTESKLESHTEEDVANLPPDAQERLALRLAADREDDERYENPGILDQFSNRILRNISNTMHENARKVQKLPPDVRAYKRNIAPLVVAISLQGYENFGFVMYDTSHVNETTFTDFMEAFDEVMRAQNGNFLNGDGLDQIEEMFMMPLQNEAHFEGAGPSQCREDFKKLRADDVLPYGLDLGVLLMVDDETISSFLDIEREDPPYLLAVDVDFDPKKNTYPEGYDGVFKVRAYALAHDLYLALSSGVMAPVDIWEILQKKTPSKADSDGKGHDEL